MRMDLSEVTHILSLPPLPKVVEYIVKVFDMTVKMVLVLSVVVIIQQTHVVKVVWQTHYSIANQ